MSNLTMWTFPHYEVRVEDLSIYTPLYREQLPLHRPIFFMRCQQGPIGVPVWCSDYNYAVRVFGRGTFDKYTKWYSREAVYLRYAFNRQGAFIVRLADSTAKYASAVIECHVTEVEVPLWQRDEYGNFLEDSDGNRIPVEGPGGPGTQATTIGYKLAWKKRVLAPDESPNTITPNTIVSEVGGTTTTIYPILALKALYPGEYGNTNGFKLYYDPERVEKAMVSSIESLVYQFASVAKTYGQDTVSPIRTTFGDVSTYVSLKDKAIDKRLEKDVAMKSVLQNLYYDKYSQTTNLAHTTKVYSEYVELIGSKIAETEVVANPTASSNPWLYNIFDATNADGIPLYSAIIDDVVASDTVVFNPNYIIYLDGGSDGDISDSAIETLTRQYLSDLVYGEIIDSARYPFTHIYDTGVTLPTKKAFIEFLGVRDDYKVILATQDCSREVMNTKDEDMSIGASLHAACVLQPESMVFGTEVCRAEIYQQAGHLNDQTIYEGFLPATIDALIKRCRWQSREFIEGMPKGLPHSGVTIFRDWNWTPYMPAHKQANWDIGLNYFQYYDMTRIHYPDIRSVYRYDTSVLSSAIFTDVIVYTKHIVRFNWARLSGVELPFARLADKAKNNVLNDMTLMLNGMYGVEVRFYQTEEEAKIGYIAHGEIKLTGYAPNRVWIVDVKCYRDGYTPEV